MMMGGGHGRLKNSAAAAAFLLAVILVNLSISARCTAAGTRQQLLGVARGGSVRATAAAAAAGHEDGHGSKIYLIFCQKSKCAGDAGHDYTCYCCLHSENSVCWKTMEDCRSTCPVCDPKCHPPLAAQRRPTLGGGGGVAPAGDGYGRVSSLVGR